MVNLGTLMTAAKDCALDDKPASLTRESARWLRRQLSKEIAPETTEMVALCVMDFLSSCIDALSTPTGRNIAHFIGRNSGRAEALQFGITDDIRAVDAAFGNAALGHSLIRDDIDVASGSHLGVIIVPALLAFAQRERLSGRQLLQGLLAGYEACARLGEVMVKFRPAQQRHFRPSGVVGAFGVAAGLAAAAHAQEDIAVSALGFGVDFASGLNQWAWSGSQEIFIHAARSASSGLSAFDLAASGLKASDHILEGPDGLFAAHSLRDGAAAAFAETLLDPADRVLSTRFKRVPGCAAIQAPIGAALALGKHQAYSSDLVRHIEIRVKPGSKANPGCDYAGQFSSAQQSKMSLQYGVCSALLYGRVDESTYLRFDDPDLANLIAMSEVVGVAEFETRSPTYRTDILVTLANGQSLSEGLPDAPWLNAMEVEARFRKTIDAASNGALADEIANTLRNLEHETSANPLFDLLSLLRTSQVSRLKES